MPTEQIADLLEEVRRVRHQLARPDITEKSQADVEFVVAEQERATRASAEGVIVLVDLWTLIAAEQLASIAALLRAEEHVYGLFPLARSVIEHSTAVVWLLDPSIAPDERSARAALAIDRSNEALVTAAAHLSDKQNETYKARRATMRDHRAAVNEEFQHGTDLRSSPRTVAGQTLLSPTDLVKHFARVAEANEREWEGIYDYFCAAANHPSLAAFEFFTEVGEGEHQLELADELLERFIRPLLASYLLAIEGYASYCGWDQSAIRQLRERSSRVFPDPSDEESQ